MIHYSPPVDRSARSFTKSNVIIALLVVRFKYLYRFNTNVILEIRFYIILISIKLIWVKFVFDYS
jgi:hypothetical protein